MRRRLMPYVICFLLASLLAVLPAAMFFDFFVPLSAWEAWYWPGQPAPRPQFALPDKLPRLLRGEMWLFRVLVMVPGSARKLFTGWEGTYASPFVSQGRDAWEGTHVGPFASQGGPPAAQALEHLRFALPFWFVLFALVYELASWVRRRRYSHVAVA
jgi:hypothetical protein